MDPASPRRPPIAQPGMPRGPPPPGSYYPGGVYDPRYRPRPPPQSHAPPLSAVDSPKSPYNRSGTPDTESEQWPLPPRPVGQLPPRSNSPSGHSPRKPPPREPRGDYQHPPEHFRQPYRMGPPPPNALRQHGPPPPMSHPPGKWNGEGNGPPQHSHPQSYSHRLPPPRAAPGANPGFGYPPPGMHYQQQRHHPRHPPGAGPPPPGARRGSPAGHPPRGEPVSQQAFVGVSNSNSNSGTTLNPAAVPPTNRSLSPQVGSNDPTPVQIPSYYFERRDFSGDSAHVASVATTIDETRDVDSAMHSVPGSERADSMTELRDEQRDEQSSPEPAPLIRQASLGKKTRPMLTTVTNGERRRGSSGDGSGHQSSFQHSLPSSREQLTPFEEEVATNLPGAWVSEGPTPDEHSTVDKPFNTGSEVALVATVGAAEEESEEEDEDEPKDSPTDFRRSSHLLGPPNGLGDPSPSETESELRKISTDSAFETKASREQDRSTPFFPVVDNNPHDAHERDPVSPIVADDFLRPEEALTDRSEKRRTRPSDLDIDAVREAEARGSMTSLPDLIRRATKLASNLDRGKTASRLGMNFFNTSDSDVDVEKYRAAVNNRRSGSISDMLTAFPSPGARDSIRKSFGNLSSMLRQSQLLSDSDALEVRERQKKKFCGMPLWLCLVLAGLLILLIAAAIVIPVVLLVVPKQHQAAGPNSASPALQRCMQQITCNNGGVNIVTRENSCSCLCVGGYTGTTCTVKSEAGCTTMSTSTANAATVGSSVSQLILGSLENFNIPLNAQSVLGLFSSSNLDCTAENTLVTFKNSAKRSLNGAAREDPTRAVERRSPSVSSAPASPSSSSSSGGGGGGGSSTGSSEADFAGTAVLYIFQESRELSAANAAQQHLQYYFDSGHNFGGSQVNAQNISLGSGFSCNLPQRRLVWTLRNGTIVAN